MIPICTGSIYPNGEFGIAKTKKFNPEPLLKEGDRRHIELVREYLPQIGFEAIAAVEKELHPQDPLGSSLLNNSHSRSPRGSKGITRQAARMVRNAAYLLEERFGRRNLTFATLTLPKISPEEGQLLAREWHTIVRTVVQRLRRDLERHRLPPLVVGVTEIQTERTDRDRILGLHLHLVWVGKKSGESWAITTKRIDEIWKEELERRLNRQVDISSACNLQQVRESAAGYLGKYMSKGTKTLAQVKEILPGTILPSAWHTMTRVLTRWIKMKTVCDSEVIESVWNDCWSKDLALTAFHGFVEIQMSEDWHYICGAFGRVKSEFLKVIKKSVTISNAGWLCCPC